MLTCPGPSSSPFWKAPARYPLSGIAWRPVSSRLAQTRKSAGTVWSAPITAGRGARTAMSIREETRQLQSANVSHRGSAAPDKSNQNARGMKSKVIEAMKQENGERHNTVPPSWLRVDEAPSFGQRWTLSVDLASLCLLISYASCVLCNRALFLFVSF